MVDRYAKRTKVAGTNPDKGTDFLFNLPNPSSRTMALGFTPPLTEMSTRKYFWEVQSGPRVKAHNLTAIYEATV
jgi:hypothetical protein